MARVMCACLFDPGVAEEASAAENALRPYFPIESEFVFFQALFGDQDASDRWFARLVSITCGDSSAPSPAKRTCGVCSQSASLHGSSGRSLCARCWAELVDGPRIPGPSTNCGLCARSSRTAWHASNGTFEVCAECVELVSGKT